VAELAVQLAKFSAWPPVIWERRVRTAAPSLPAFAGNVPDKSFFSGNDIYQWCQTDKTLAQGYVVCMYDMAAHAAYSIDGMRHFGAMTAAYGSNRRYWQKSNIGQNQPNERFGIRYSKASERTYNHDCLDLRRYEISRRASRSHQSVCEPGG
jgi:hypothetical protein